MVISKGIAERQIARRNIHTKRKTEATNLENRSRDTLKDQSFRERDIE